MEISGEPGARLEQVLEETISMDRSTPSEAIVSESGLSQLVLDSVVVADCGLETVDDLELGEDDQLAAAIQLSMQAMEGSGTAAIEEMETDEAMKTGLASGMKEEVAQSQTEEDEGPQDLSEALEDPDILQEILSGLPGVDPSSETIQNVIQTTRQQKEERERKKNDQ
jgi:hypothetical protein